MLRRLCTGLVLALLALPAAAQAPAGQPAARPTPAAPPAAAPAAPQPGGAARPAAQDTVDLNVATAAELDALPGIGPARAAAILANRPYRTPEEVVTKGAIPRSVFDAVRARLTAFQINVNAATRQEMVDTLPGIGAARADAIIRSRPYANLDELASKAGVPGAVLERIRPALTLR